MSLFTIDPAYTIQLVCVQNAEKENESTAREQLIKAAKLGKSHTYH